MAIQDMTFDPLKPYNNLPPLPPKADIETKAILRKAITAGRTLASIHSGEFFYPSGSQGEL
jgi:hypothetical protein